MRFVCSQCHQELPTAESAARHVLQLNEMDRQLLLLALAKLASDRRGFADALGRIAAQIDGKGENALFAKFQTIK